MKLKPFYFIKEALISLKRNLLASVIAITTVAISLVVLGAFVIVALNFDQQIKLVEDVVEITIHLKDSATTDQILAAENQIQGMSLVRSVKYISKEEALNLLKKRFKKQPDIVQELQGNPLPASLEVRLKDPKKVTELANNIKGKYPEVIDEIIYGKDYVSKLFAVTRFIRWTGTIFIILLWVASMVVIANTIRLAIFARRKEIGIMKLVGATNWFIRWPFLVEGIIQGFLGVVLALLMLWMFNAFIFQNLLETVKMFRFDAGIINTFQLTAVLSVAGIAIGAFGSMVALRRFLHV